MDIKSVEFRNFRPYRDTSANFRSDSGHIHVVEGPQGAGKTSFHRAIQWGLFGGDGPGHNYNTNWNDDARAEGDKEMHVEIQFLDSGHSYTLLREITSFNPDLERAKEKLHLMTGDETMTGEDAQEFIHSRIPQELKDFFFLDGEEIQRLIDDEVGKEVKTEIEKVLKHTAILNGQEDLETLLDDRYRDNLDELESEYEERNELLSEITNKNEEKSGIRDDISSLRDDLEDVESNLEKAREMLKERNKEAHDKINDLESDLEDLAKEELDTAKDLQKGWEQLPVEVLSDEIEDLCISLRKEEQKIEQQLEDAQRREIIQELTEDAANGPCPICGTENCTPDHADHTTDEETASIDLNQRLVQCQQRRETLESIDEFDYSLVPSGLEEDLIEIREGRKKISEERDELMDEYGGQLTDSEKGDLKASVSELESQKEDIEQEIDDKEDDLEEIEREIKKLKAEKKEKAGNSDINRLEEKIEVAEEANESFNRIREAHIQNKRDKIREEMNDVFEMVSQSKFIKARYRGIDFKGDPHDDDEYVLQLVKNNGDRKRMDDHPPSAGETQLTALSFIFGLNKYARYSTTIVFDTVAGRLDLKNSRAQGEFFSSLDESVILLVTDAEYQKLGEKMGEEVGTHHRIEPNEDMDSILVEVDN